MSVFSNSYTNIPGTDFFPNWGQSTNYTPCISGSNNMIAYYNLDYQGIHFQSPLNVSTMDTIHLDVYSRNITSLDFYLINGLINNVNVEVSHTITLTLNEWNSIDALGSVNTKIIDSLNSNIELVELLIA